MCHMGTNFPKVHVVCGTGEILFSKRKQLKKIVVNKQTKSKQKKPTEDGKAQFKICFLSVTQTRTFQLKKGKKAYK